MAKLIDNVLVKESFVRCTQNLAHIPRYAETPMQCTSAHAHSSPHTYDSKNR
jgi:hypothetical protein